MESPAAYDDSYHLTPARLLRNAVQLGYRGWFNHYVGMSHHYEMAWDGTRFVASGGLNAPARGVACRLRDTVRRPSASR